MTDTPSNKVSRPDGTRNDEPARSKTDQRRRFRAIRKHGERRQRQADAALLNRNLLGMEAVATADCLAGYLAFDGEPDIRFCLTQLCRRGVRVVLPIVPGPTDGDLRFRRWTPATPLTVNRYGVSEPRGGEDVPVDRIDSMLLPLVAFDRRGTRLGMGAGWYDRILAQPEFTATRIGVAWSRQEARLLPVDDWDQPLDAVVTEREWFTCSS